MKKFLAIALLVLSCNIAFAQNKVTGKVTSSEDGSPIPFASVVIKGTLTGEATDDNGAFTLTNVPANAVLEISSIGFLTQTVQVNGKSVINVSLSPDSEALDEVMVVAYGTVKKGSYSGSAAVVKQDAIKDAPVVSFEQVLAGKAPGVQVASYSGQPGSEAEISIRGFGSLNAGNQPLYVIDGVPATSGDYSSGNISTGSMNFLNPGDIESVTILKDAAAASLYGSRASNGVILITTKKGKMGKITTNFKASVGMSYWAYNNYPLCNDAENEAMHRMSWLNYANEEGPSEWEPYGSIDNYVNEMVEEYYPKKDESKYIYKDWEDVLFRTGINQNYELSVSGGGEKARVYASVAWTDQQGVVSIDYLRRFSTTVNAEASLAKWLKVGGTVQYSWQYQTGHQDGWSSKDNPFFIWKVVLNPRWPYAYKDTGELYLKEWSPSFSTVNPVATYENQINDAYQNRLMLKGWAEATFTDWLKLKTTVSDDWLYVRDKFAWTYGHPNFYAYSDIGGYIGNRHRNVDRLVTSTVLNFDKTWDKHHVSAMAGWESEREKYFMSTIGKIDFSYMGATESYLSTGFDGGYSYTRDCTLLSALGSLNYDYAGKYYITGTFRRDGSSKLAPQTRWGNFWSVSGSWRFSNEEFIKADWLNDAKIRGSYGTSGTLPSDYFGYMALYDYTGYGQDGASYPSTLGNEELTWEKNKNWNVALDATIFDRVTLTAEYYSKLTTDLLLDARIPSVTGFSSTLKNIGSMSNKGWELAVNVDILKNVNGWNLSVGANWSTVKNKIVSLTEDGAPIIDTPYIWQPGYNFYQFYTREYLGVCQEDGYLGNSRLKAGYPMYAEGSHYEAGEIADQKIIMKDGTVIEKGQTVPKDTYNYFPENRQNASNMIIEGKTAIPKGFGGFNLNLGWKGLTLDMAWSYKYGHYIWDDGVEQMESDGYYWSHRNIAKDQLNAWTPTNTNTDVPKRVADNGQGGYYYSSRYLKKGDFLRLKNLTLSYNLPKNFVQKLAMSNARIYVAGANLLTFSGLNIDPEIQASGYYYYVTPALRTVTFGIDLSF